MIAVSEFIRLAVMLYVCFPLSLRNVEGLLPERGIDVSHETIWFWWNRFGPMFASEIASKRWHQARNHSNWQWHFDEVFVKINGDRHCLCCAVAHEGEVLKSYVSKRRDRKSAFLPHSDDNHRKCLFVLVLVGHHYRLHEQPDASSKSEKSKHEIQRKTHL